MTDDQIQHIVTRFLAWSLPENFNPDGGVSFSRLGVNGFTYPMPVGTNLLDHEQATAMVRYITSGATDDATVQALTERLENERAAGWRDAVSCVQYCVANWHQDRARRTGEGEALIAAGEELVDELVNGEPSDWLGTEWKSAQKWMAELNALTEERDAALERVKALADEIDGFEVVGTLRGTAFASGWEAAQRFISGHARALLTPKDPGQ